MEDTRSVMPKGPLAWNALAIFVEKNTLSLSTFRRQVKHFLLFTLLAY